MIRRRLLIAGRVQGVYYRDTCRRMAESHGVTGWVRNLHDGRVEAVFEGPAAPVAALVAWAAEGPESAVVTGVAVHEEPPQGLPTFDIR